MSRKTLPDLEFDSHKYISARKSLKRVVEESCSLFNSIQVVTTTIGTTATKINTPDNCYSFFLEHQESGETVYLGDSSVTTSTGYPVIDNQPFPCNNFAKGNNNELYGICSTGTVKVYAVGAYKQ